MDHYLVLKHQLRFGKVIREKPALERPYYYLSIYRPWNQYLQLLAGAQSSNCAWVLRIDIEFLRPNIVPQYLSTPQSSEKYILCLETCAWNWLEICWFIKNIHVFILIDKELKTPLNIHGGVWLMQNYLFRWFRMSLKREYYPLPVSP